MEHVLDRPFAAAPGEGRLSYYTSQPAPTQWIAVGVLTASSDVLGVPRRRLLVGAGRDETAAIAALQRRVAAAWWQRD